MYLKNEYKCKMYLKYFKNKCELYSKFPQNKNISNKFNLNRVFQILNYFGINIFSIVSAIII